ncbi:penicillin-binding transpeptidase domain-containing protein [Nocardioides zeae]|uniref:Beta-lactamase n=1 Tax=Nocardioides imazamoxiresistens TaxID=3231893 RepID=A0ABU3PVV2_9ACTN|nr:penicillin-binding transpeptidase domain-containing protein [Nocardioides zeae]MDT9592875.1 penicillin-binding transpeptidase domain-containing protein [Nocardioides zeae]
MRTTTRSPGGARTRTALLALAVAATGTLSACSDDGREEAADAADRFAEALVSGDFDEVGFTDADTADVAEQYATIVAGMGGTEPDVAADEVDVEDGTGTARLSWSWDVRATTWTYTTEVALRRADDDAWQVGWTPEVVEGSLAPGERLSASVVAPQRGDVLAGDGQPIVTLRDVIRYGIDRSLTDPETAQTSARALAEALEIDADAYVQRVAAAGERAFVEALVVRAEDADLELLAGTPGVAALPQQRSLAPTRTFAAPILGSVGEATAEVVEESDGAVAAGDVVGLSGLQARYDDQLRGEAGLRVVAEDEDGERRELHTVEAVAGTPLPTTLSIGLQQLAETQLAGVGPASALVAIRPSDGAVLAAASGPGSGGQNTATFGQYAPGSTFKVVTSLALLRAGLTPDATVTCPATTTVDGRTFGNYSDYPAGGTGDIPLRTAVANSCNTAFITSRDLLAPGDLAGAAAALGLGVDHDLGFPAYFGQVPEPESQTEDAASLIGQGRVLASPLTMATVAASVAAGRTVVPQLLPEVDTAPAEPATPLTAEETAALQEMMRGVVTDGSGRVLAGVPGDPVGAKTGTAEYGTETPPATHAWMIAFQGDLAVAVFVETGESGSSTAGPVLAAFLEGARG